MNKWCKRVLSIWICLAFVLPAALSKMPAAVVLAEENGAETFLLSTLDPVTDSSEYKNNEILVAFADGDDTKENKAFLSGLNGIQIEDMFYEYALLKAESKEQLERAVDILAGEERIAYVQPNYICTIDVTGQDEPEFGKQWGLDNQGSFDADISSVYDMDINAKEAWEVFPKGGREVVVAVIDTGIDISHEDLKDKIWVNPDEKENGADSDRNGYDDDINGWNFFDDSNEIYKGRYNDYTKDGSAVREYEDDHGTHVAGIIAASHNGIGAAGVAGNINIKIMPLKVAGIIDKKTGSVGGDSADMIKAVKYAQANGARICNISMGFNGRDAILENVIKNSAMLVVTAAGNGTKETKGKGYDIDKTPSYPAAFTSENIITVANVNYNGELDKSSCYGSVSVDVGAPGTQIFSTLAGKESAGSSLLSKYTGSYRYGYMTGTSMASPMVTGAAAMVYAYYPGISVNHVRQILLATTRSLASLKGKTVTGGMIDLHAALTSREGAKLSDITVPSIKAEVSAVTDSYKKTLTVTVTDNGKNLSKVYYARGKKTAEYFADGSKGTKIAVKDNKVSKKITITDPGTYTIYAGDSAGNSAILNKKIDIKSIELNTASKTLKTGETYRLKGAVVPSSYKGTITYASSDSRIASVDKKTGKITAKKKGKVTITAKVKNGKPAKCTITVK